MFRVLHRYEHHGIKNPWSLRFISQISPSITIDYLINSCGLSPATAISVSKDFHLDSTKNPDSVLSFFQNYGLTKTHIKELISKRPSLLHANPEKTLKPKIDFLQRLGVSGSDLTRLVCSDPMLLQRSLKNQFIPSFDFLKSFLHTDENVLIAFKRSTWVLRYNLVKVMGPNISALQNLGISETTISKLLATQPRTLMQRHDRFNDTIDVIKQMGFNPLSPMFVLGIRTMAGMSSLNWKRKVGIYKEFGFSDEQFLSMFRNQPSCMIASEKKIRRGLDFFINKMKMKLSEICSCPNVICFSMKTRIVPRCAVMEILYSEGVLRKRYSLGWILKLTEEDFLEKFVITYKERLPQLMKCAISSSQMIAVNFLKREVFFGTQRTSLELNEPWFDQFKELVDGAIKQMQISPSSPMFILRINNHSRDEIINLEEQNLGFTGNLVSLMNKFSPCSKSSLVGCTRAAGEKIRRVLEFLLKRYIHYPNVFCFSMKRRIEHDFLERHVIKYQERLPQLVQGISSSQ